MAAAHGAGQPPDPRVVGQAVAQLLQDPPAAQRLDPATRAMLRDSAAKVAGYLSADPHALGGAGALGGNGPLAGQLAPPIRPTPVRSDLVRGPAPGGGGGAAAPAPAGPTGRVGDVARATLNAIDFPAFVASLIQGTFQAIVDASIQQMEAYAELLKNCALTVDQFMDDHVNEGTAKDHLVQRYPDVFGSDLESGSPQLVINEPPEGDDAPLPSFFQDLGFEDRSDIDEEAVQQKIVPATRRTLAEQRQQTLATMVLMGINRIVVDDGEINAKLQFHIDASEETKLRFTETKTSMGNLGGSAGRRRFDANGLMVNTSTLNAQSDMNVRADLTGEVRVKFRSETFPLERFADSAAIQLINNSAAVPAPAQAAAPPAPGAPAPAAPPAPAAAPAPAAPAAPAPAPAPAPTAQAGLVDDPWAPRSAT
jgi:hypothetical protein